MTDCYLNKWICKSCYNGFCSVHKRSFEIYPLPNLEYVKCLYCNNIAEYFICALISEFKKGVSIESI